MKLAKLIISNYRCFGKTPTVIEINDMTSFIGHNSSGKTSVISALVKLFSERSSERIIERSDFHVPSDKEVKDIDSNELFIEAQFEFPELEDTNSDGAVPIFFKNMVVEKPGGKLYLRIRLEADWVKSSNPEGSINTNIYYITISDDEITDENKKYARRNDLDQIKLLYIPAIRKPDIQLKNVSGTIISRLLNGIKWSEVTKETLRNKINETEGVFFKEKGVVELGASLKNQWNGYHKDGRYSNPKINFNSADLETILKKVNITFSPTEVLRDYQIDELGDGLQSLFYLSLVNTLLDIEEQIIKTINNGKEHDAFSLVPPMLTIVAVEEPENHISPHLLGRVIEKICQISNKDNSQAILTSHSPSIVKRIEPKDIRYFCICNKNKCSKVKSLALPDQEKEADQYKYIKEAILSFPEIYFAKLVVLGEGDSEELIIKKLIELKNVSVDSAEISIVPLGGRHVNHLWRLLNDLEITYITLLDLDRERFGGGWGRIKYALGQLFKLGIKKEELLHTKNCIVTYQDYEAMNRWDNAKIATMSEWINLLKSYNVYFSIPLDIDFAMLKSFKEKYIKLLLSNEGPRIAELGKIEEIDISQENTDSFLGRVETDIRYALKHEGGNGSTYTDDEKKLMIWYTYFFLGRGKPTTHFLFFLKNTDLKFEDFPECLREFVNRIIDIISIVPEEKYNE